MVVLLVTEGVGKECRFGSDTLWDVRGNSPHVAVGAHGFTNRPIAVYLNQGLIGAFV